MLGGGAGGGEGGGGLGLGLDLSAVIQAAVAGLVLFSVAVVVVRRATSRYFAADSCNGHHHHWSLLYPMGNPQEQWTDLTGRCAACGGVASKKCSRCKRVRYCSQDCQTKHWQSEHKFKCKQMESLDPANKLFCGGQIAEGKHCFSCKPHAAASKGLEAAMDNTTHLDFTDKNPWTVPTNVGAPSFAFVHEEQHSPLRLHDPRTHGWDDEFIQTQGTEKHSSHQHVQHDRQKKRSSHQRLKNSDRQGLGTELQQDHSKTINLQGQEFSMTRCLAVLKDMVGLSDDVKIQASEVFKDALNREIFLGYETRLRALWLTKEVNKLAVLSKVS